MTDHQPGWLPVMRNRWIAAAVVGFAVIGALILRGGGDAHRLSVQAPEPIPGSSGPVIPELPYSVFSVPVEVQLARLMEVVEGALPTTVGDIEERIEIPDQNHLTVAFQIERGPLSASFSGSTATLGGTLSYQARAWYNPPILPEVSASCGTGEGELQPRLSVALSTPLTLDEDWRLRSEIRADEIAPPTETDRDRCRVTVLNFDMTARVVSAARGAVEDFAPRADSALAELDLRSDFAEWWNLIAQPIRLTDDVWLVMAPSALGRGPITGTGETIRTTLTLQARPRVVIAAEAPEVDAPQLPPLRPLAGESGLRILAEADANYGEVVTLLEDEIVGRPLEVGDREIVVRDVRIRGVGDGRISVGVTVSGDAEGDLYLVGTPMYDAAVDQIAVPDLDFDVATREAIVAGAAWIARAGLAEALRQRARWPAAPAVDWAREQVESGFNTRLSDDVRLEGSVDTVSVLGVYAERETLRVRAEVRGRATLVVEGGQR